ncbi:NACHT domain-containing protein [Actinomadura flavalba]|uniref:NACHT domain-containing protein n=1 Tax=Actinomadura flavalba TaxID=1120938 RepID=UPI000382BC71|nr:NACHT domain-containing protein [Actinomadura flavalba]
MRRWVLVWILVSAVVVIVASVLFVVPLPGLDDADKIASLVGATSGLLSLGVAVWAALLSRRALPAPPGSADGLAAAVEELAAAVRDQWHEESITRSLGDNDRLLTLRWSVRNAAANPGPPQVRELNGPVQVLDAYRATGARRLVVVGGAGSGKSALAVLLTRGVAELRTAGDIAPVYVSLASWNPELNGLRTWLARRLAEDYPFLRGRDAMGKDMPERLVRAPGALLFVLDGLDEIRADLRVRALREIGRAGLTDLVLTCREDDYDAAQRAGGITVAGAAHATIEPLAVADLDPDFFAHGCTPEQAARWVQVLDRVRRRPGGRLARTLRTPLMAALARDVYRHPARDPRDLLRTAQFPTTEAIERHLAGALVPALFGTLPLDERRRGWEGRDAERWLRYLAAGLPADGTIRWWELSRYVRTPDRVLSAVFGAVTVGPAIGLGFALLWGTLAGVVIGAAFALVMAVAAARTLPPPSALYLGDLRSPVAPLAGAMVVGAVAVVVCSIREGLAFGVPAGLVLGVPIGFVYLWAKPDATVRPVTPRRLLHQDVWVAVTFGLTYGLTTGAVVGFAVDVLYGAVFGLFCGLSGAFLYGPVWLAAFRVDNAGVIGWMHYTFARLLLVPRGRLPWRTLAFLEEAHRRGALRQVGAVYEFRHKVVREALAERTTP